jgi:starvation-inducible DNA-binding protein
MRPTQNSLPESVRAQSTFAINNHLAAAIDLHSHIKQAEWNVQGASYEGMRVLLGSAARLVAGYCDALAERCGALGDVALGTVELAAARSFLPDYLVLIAVEQEHACAITRSIAAYAHSMQNAIASLCSMGDPVTAALFTRITDGLERQLWLFERYIAPSPLAVSRNGRSDVWPIKATV